MKRPMCIFVRDKRGDEWAFEFHGDPRHLPAWRAAGLDVLETVAVVPERAVRFGLTKAFIWAQAAWQWLRLF